MRLYAKAILVCLALATDSLAQLPTAVTLKEPVDIPVVADGQTYGAVTLSRGTTLPVRRQNGDTLYVDFRGKIASVPAAKTDFAERVAAIKKQQEKKRQEEEQARLAAQEKAKSPKAAPPAVRAPHEEPEEDFHVEIIRVERKIERRIGDADYEAGVEFDGRSWSLRSVHYPTWMKDRKDDDLKDWDKMAADRKKWGDMTCRSDLFREEYYQENVDLFTKFVEWDSIATSNQVAPFRKQIAKLEGIFTQDFVWDGKSSRLSSKMLDSTEIRLFIELLARTEEIRREWRTKKAESNKAKEMFK
jgi:hypothetical protein